MQLDPQIFASQLESEKQKAELDVLGAAIDDRGVISTFKQVLTITLKRSRASTKSGGLATVDAK